MQPIDIELTEPSGIDRSNEPCRIGVPIHESELTPADNVVLYCAKEKRERPCQSEPLSFWPDGSIRWLKITFQIDLKPYQTKHLSLQRSQLCNAASPPASPLKAEIIDQKIEIITGRARFTLDRMNLCWQASLSRPHAQPLKTHFIFSNCDESECEAQLDQPWQITESGHTAIVLKSSGKWSNPAEDIARFDITLHFFHQSSTIQVETTLHNPNRAQHAGGLWDLGDPGSIHFQSLKLSIKTPNIGQTELLTHQGCTPLSTTQHEPLRIFQGSSGGKHWNSRNHLKHSDQLTTTIKGFQVHKSNQLIAYDDRASPMLLWRGKNAAVQIYIEDFWQNFPKALSANNRTLSIELFPSEQDSRYELQGGEKKTHTCFIDYSESTSSLSWSRDPVLPRLSASHYESTNAFPWFKLVQAPSAEAATIDAIIQQGVEGPNNFYAKREIIDEYGWRNFGDIFADHETHYQAPNEPVFISHYNNQYDPIYGFSRQFALSGDRRWWDLLNDLSKHVTDIDIYHTDKDRAEYNGGLFWHTDHYLDAHTATHRTYSSHNQTSSIPGQTGGGPAAEHCYSTGLLYHYWLTGNSRSRDAVLKLANWMISNQEGKGGLLEQLLALKKHDLPKLKALLKNESPSTHHYPFTRGTGNYINTLLDAAQLTGDQHWLERVESIIYNTIHPGDNIKKRDLLNVEVAWSYLVLLQSLVKYLGIKEERRQYDEHFQFALDAFAHYSRWMAQNERPFLSNPEILEFPNDTWAAQDIRKVMLMHQAAYYDPERASQYLSKAEEWLLYISSTLSKSDEARYTRIMVILMQNYGPHHFKTINKAPPLKRRPSVHTKQPILTWKQSITRIGTRLISGLIHFRPSKERTWIMTRLNR